MKKNINYYLGARDFFSTSMMLSLFLIGFIVFSVQAQQEFPKASVSEIGRIILDVNTPVSSDYQMDISHLNFENEYSANEFFKSLSDGAVSFTVDFINQTATVHLRTEMLAKADMDWDVKKWNEYFQRKVESLKHIKG